MSYARVLVGNRFGSLLAELDSADVEFASWRLNNIGQCRFSIAANDAKATEEILRFGNRVLIEFENGLPNWVGLIDPARDWSNGLITIDCFGPGKILEYRITDKGRYFDSDPAGAIFEDLIVEVNGVEDTGIVIGSIWNGGGGHSPDYHIKSVWQILTESIVKKLSTYDFDFTGSIVDGKITIQANFYDSLGSDKTGWALIQDKNLASVKLKEQGPIINQWTVAGEGTDWGSARLMAVAEDIVSINTYGLRQAAAVFGDVSELATLEDHAANLLAASKNPYNIYTLAALDTDPAGFSVYGIGDTISLLAPDYGFAGGTDTTIRILSREFNPKAGVCNLVVEEQF